MKSMQKHPTEVLALLFGLAFGIVGAAFVVYETTDQAVDPAWLAAAGLIVLGVIALTITLVRGAREPLSEDARVAETPER